MNYFVEIIKHGENGNPEEVVKRMGPMSERKAEQVDKGANINLNHEDFFTRITKEKVKQ
jgi:hypothetical protein